MSTADTNFNTETTMTTTAPVAFHYTTGAHIRSILQSGAIRLDVGPTLGNDRPCVWLTTSAVWEPTCWKQINGRDVHDPAEIARLTGGVYRIGIDTRKKHIRTITQWRRESGCPPFMQQALIDQAAEKFNVNPERDWRVSFRPLHAGYWLSVEGSRDGATWEPLLGHQQIQTCLRSPAVNTNTTEITP